MTWRTFDGVQPGVHAEVAGIGVGGGEGVGGVHQAALFADFLEQPGGHAAAQDGVEHAHDVAALVRGDDAWGSP